MNYLGDLDIEHGDDNELEIEVEQYDPARARLREHGQQLLQDLEPGHMLDLLGR